MSGSKVILTLAFLSVLLSCSAPRSATRKPTPPSRPVEREDKVRVYDPKTDSYILVPRESITVDTVIWKEDPAGPVVTDDPVRESPKPSREVREIAILMPFNAANAEIYTERQDSRLVRFIQYYAGIQIALDQMNSRYPPLRFFAYDASDPAVTLTNILNRPEVKQADVIIGPYEKKDLETVSNYGLQHEVMVLSPWLPAFSISTENPFFIQLFPALSTHAAAILEYIHTDLRGKKVYVVARDIPGEVNRFQFFKQHPEVQVEELIIRDNSPELASTQLHPLLEDTRGTIFIMPYYARSDEPFINAFMRKLHADKGTREAIVFGLPQWTGFANLNSNYMESLSLHLSSSSFPDVGHPHYTSFRTQFFEKYHTVPDLNAFQGYDLMMWLTRRLATGGQEDLINAIDPTGYGLASGFDIRPVYKENFSNRNELKSPLYYENKRIRILRYLAQDFILIK